MLRGIRTSISTGAIGAHVVLNTTLTLKIHLPRRGEVFLFASAHFCNIRGAMVVWMHLALCFTALNTKRLVIISRRNSYCTLSVTLSGLEGRGATNFVTQVKVNDRQ